MSNTFRSVIVTPFDAGTVIVELIVETFVSEISFGTSALGKQELKPVLNLLAAEAAPVPQEFVVVTRQ